MRYWSRQNDIF